MKYFYTSCAVVALFASFLLGYSLSAAKDPSCKAQAIRDNATLVGSAVYRDHVDCYYLNVPRYWSQLPLDLRKLYRKDPAWLEKILSRRTSNS